MLPGRAPIGLSWSPDGTMLAFVVLEEDGYPSLLTLRVMNADGSDKRKLATYWSAEFDPGPVSWSQDGNEIAYSLSNSHGDQIGSVHPNGTGNRVLSSFTDARIADVDWLADGRLALVADFPGPGVATKPWIFDPDDGTRSQLHTTYSYSLDPSPDGLSVAAEQYDGLYRLPLDGSPRTRISLSESIYGPVWSPDGSQLAFSSDFMTGTGAVNVDGTCPIEIVKHPAYFLGLAWQPLSTGSIAAPLRCSDLAVKATKDRSYVQKGHTMVIGARITNVGRDPATESVLKFSVGSGFAPVSASTSQGTCVVKRPVRCSLGTVAVDQEVTVSVTIRALQTSAESVDGPFPQVFAAEDANFENDFDWGDSAFITVCSRLGTGGRDVLVGGPKADYLCGLGGNDVLRGMGGRDILEGGGGNDTIHAGWGTDHVYGGPGDDWLYGEDGGDRVDAGPGRDHVYGGRGEDVILARDRFVDWIDGGPGNDSGQNFDRSDHVTSVER